MKSINRRDVAIGSGVFALAVFALLVLVPSGIVQPGGVEIAALSPSFWPRVVLVGMALCGLVICCQGLFFRDSSSAQPVQEQPLAPNVALIKLLLAIGLLFGYFFAIRELGIVLASVIVLLAMMFLGGETRWKLLLSVALILPIGLYYFFTYVANVPLPLGLFQD